MCAVEHCLLEACIRDHKWLHLSESIDDSALLFSVGGGGLERDASGSENIFLFWLTRSEEIGAGGKLSFFCAASNTLSRKLSSVNQPKAPFSGVSSLDKKPR